MPNDCGYSQLLLIEFDQPNFICIIFKVNFINGGSKYFRSSVKHDQHSKKRTAFTSDSSTKWHTEEEMKEL